MEYCRQDGPESITHEVIFSAEEVRLLFKNEIFRALEKRLLKLLPESQPPRSGGILVALMSATEQDFPEALSLRWTEAQKTDGRTMPSTPPPMMFREED